MEEITQQIKRRRSQLIGHVLRRNTNEHLKVALTWTLEGRRRGERPGETWRRTVERERGEFGFKGWLHAGTCAKNREAWRTRTWCKAPFSL